MSCGRKVTASRILAYGNDTNDTTISTQLAQTTEQDGRAGLVSCALLVGFGSSVSQTKLCCSQNHRIIGVGMGLWRPLNWTSWTYTSPWDIMGCAHKCWGNWPMSVQGHSRLSLKGQSNQKRLLKNRRKKTLLQKVQDQRFGELQAN